MKGILMKDFLINPIIEGHKTQTRRIIKTPEHAYGISGLLEQNEDCFIFSLSVPDGYENYKVKPRYNKGEIVYIKENHLRFNHPDNSVSIKHFDYDLNTTYYKSSNLTTSVSLKKNYLSLDGHYEAGWKKQSKLLLPEFAARHYIKITDVRVERLQDISDEDCIKEGIAAKPHPFLAPEFISPHLPFQYFELPAEAFKALINDVDGKETWDSNPYVFVYEFEYFVKKDKVGNIKDYGKDN